MGIRRSIVCGVDGSPESQAALAVAARLADRLDLRLVVAHVAEPPHVPYAAAAPFGGVESGQVAVEQEIERERVAAQRLLDDLVAAARLAEVERRIAVGLPAERLAELGDDESAELIVVGSRGRGALQTAFLGSVSKSLVGIARCPVVIVPRGSSEPA